MKIGTITFHGAHNYGSVLQAYALQTFIGRIGIEEQKQIEYSIINFRSKKQKYIYQKPRIDSIKSTGKRLMYLCYNRKLNIQGEKFETFINDYLHLGEEFDDSVSLPDNARDYDVLLAGSDQIWNIRADDFSYAYLFEGCNGKKISYAASLGPLSIDWNKYDNKKYGNLLKQFEHVSVREEKSKAMAEAVAEGVIAETHVDPTLLLSVMDWRAIQSEYNYNDGRYILFYCLEPTKKHIQIANMLSKMTGLPVVSTKYRGKKDFFNPFIKLYDAGPRDFLSLIDHASLVLTSSFHGTVFSILYGKKFFVIDGLNDGRIRSLLINTKAEKNNISLSDTDITHAPSFIDADSFLIQERYRAKHYLMAAIGVENAKPIEVG